MAHEVDSSRAKIRLQLAQREVSLHVAFWSVFCSINITQCNIILRSEVRYCTSLLLWCPACRDVQWSAELLHYAWHHKAKVIDMEAQLADLVSSAQKRRSLPNAPKQERHVMHQLAAAYGLSSQSFGSEPARHIDLFKVSRSEISP